MKKHFSFLGLAALLTAAALTSCQKEEWEMDSPSEQEYIPEMTRGTATAFTTPTINWNKITTISVDSNNKYPAISSLQATCDANYLYLRIKVDSRKLTKYKSYPFAYELNVWLGNSNDTNDSNWLSSQKGKIIKNMHGWILKNGKPVFTPIENAYLGANVKTDGNYYYYELKYPRSIDERLSHSQVNIGVTLKENGKNNNNNVSGTNYIGICPAKGSSMYWKNLKDYTGTDSSIADNVILDKKFNETSKVIPNPERGLYKMNYYFYSSRYEIDGKTKKEVVKWEQTDANLDLSDLDENGKRSTDDTRLIMTMFYLNGETWSDNISNTAVPYIKKVLKNIRKQGKKAIVRIGYNNVHPSQYDQEPNLKRIKQHIADLKNTFEEYKDVIYVVQAGFIGTYGEWYYTSHFGPKDGGVDYSISDNRSGYVAKNSNGVSTFKNRAEVIDALIKSVPSPIQIAFRTPEYKQCYLCYNNNSKVSNYTELNEFGTDALHRLSFHNDAFLRGGGDTGTFSADWQYEMWKKQGAFLINGGETPYTDKSITGMDGYSKSKVKSGIFNYHYSYLHHDTGYHTNAEENKCSELMRYWHKQGWMNDIKKWLGYRLWVKRITMKGENKKNAKASVSITINNSGSAPVMYTRNMKLLLISGSLEYTLSSNFGDAREVPSGVLLNSSIVPGSESFTFDVTLPKKIEKNDKLVIFMPDADIKGNGLNKRPEYAIQLANDNVSWEGIGYNVIHTF